MINRQIFYRSTDGTEMTDGEKLRILLSVGRLDSARAAKLSHVAKSTIDAYRSPASARPVPARILLAPELEVFDRLKQDAKAAGYALRRAA